MALQKFAFTLALFTYSLIPKFGNKDQAFHFC